MMRSIRRIELMIGLVVLTSIPAIARVYWGVRAGIARSSLVQKIDLDYWSGSCVGYSVAGLADIPFYERFSFRPEIALAYEGGSFHSEHTKGLFLKHRLRNYSLQPSFNIAFNIPISGVKMAVYLGPALDLHLWDEISTGRIDENLTDVKETAIRPVDIGANAGISVEYKGVFFSINSLAGSLYRQKEKTEDSPPVFQNNIMFSLGYIFR
jgi:hypothetical protein